MALTIESILAIDFSDIDQSVVLAKGLAPGKIVVQCYSNGKINIYSEAHRIHKTKSITLTLPNGVKRKLMPPCRVIDDRREAEACLKAQILADYFAMQGEAKWPTYNNALNENDKTKLAEDPQYRMDSVVGRLKAKTCDDPRVLAAFAKSKECKDWLKAQAEAHRLKMEEKFVMAEESELMTKEMRIARAREMARKQVAEATGSKRAANG